MRALTICIIADTHDHRKPLAAAVAEAKTRGAQVVLHCGNPVALCSASIRIARARAGPLTSNHALVGAIAHEFSGW